MVIRIEDDRLKDIDAAALFGVCLTLSAAFYFQLAKHELPCAFCNLIRVSLMIFGGGLLLNLRFWYNAWNYVVSAVGALIGSLISLLFLFVKVPQNSTPTGSAILGLHMYGWTFLISTASGMYCVLMLALHANNSASTRNAMFLSGTTKNSRVYSILMGLFALLVGANLVSAFLQNGFDTFKGGGQRHYRMLYRGDIMKP